MDLIGYYQFLYGMLDIPRISYQLNHYEKIEDEGVLVSYGLQRGNLNDEQWKILLLVLEKGGFQQLLTGFLNHFSFPQKVFQIMVELYGIEENKWEYLLINWSKVDYKFVCEVYEKELNSHVVLVHIRMPELYQCILDPCISSLVETYNDALLHYIDIKIEYGERSFFHKAQACDSWLEEIFCYAFEQVIGSDGNISCCSSITPNLDILSNVPAFILGVQGGNEELSQCFCKREKLT